MNDMTTSYIDLALEAILDDLHHRYYKASGYHLRDYTFLMGVPVHLRHSIIADLSENCTMTWHGQSLSELFSLVEESGRKFEKKASAAKERLK